MRKIKSTIQLVATMALALLAVGCSNSLRDKQNLVAAAGFQIITPTSPAQVAILNSLPAGKVTPTTYEGKQYFVLPDAPNNRAWVGGPKQYQAFQQMRLARQLSNENLQAAQMNQMASMQWGGWGGWGGGWGGGTRGGMGSPRWGW